MKNFILIIFLFAANFIFGQELYIKEYGEAKNPPIMFLHGGPGFNSMNFELSTAQELANNGFFVIVYDRRGEGRSADLPARYDFQETTQDIDRILNKYNLKHINFVAHSFGGIVATRFAEKYPEKVKSIVFASAPFSFQNILKETLAAVKVIYTQRNDTLNLSYVTKLENMDPHSIEYSSYILMHAMMNKFYVPKAMSPEVKNRYTGLFKDEAYVTLSKKVDTQSPSGFWKNEKYTSITIDEQVKKLMKKNIKVFGIYGKEDGILPLNEVDRIRGIIGNKNLVYLDNCSHNLFIDQQNLFINSLKNWIKK